MSFIDRSLAFAKAPNSLNKICKYFFISVKNHRQERSLKKNSMKVNINIKKEEREEEMKDLARGIKVLYKIHKANSESKERCYLQRIYPKDI